MAVALWAAAETGPVAWVGLDEFDNGPGTFWSYAVAALRRSGVALPRELRALPQGRDHDDEFLLRLTAALAAQDPPLTLVLDDLHLLNIDPGVLKGLDFMLRNAGSALRVVVTSRVDPLLPLHRYRWPGRWPKSGPVIAPSASPKPNCCCAARQHVTADSLESLTQRTEGWRPASPRRDFPPPIPILASSSRN